jgi:hypothetical protein
MASYFSEVARMTWWRADRYDIGDGYITPAADAKWLSFDPWEEVESTARHESLMQLISNTRRGKGPSVDNYQAVEKWVSQNGLLGLLHQRVREVTLAPRESSQRSRLGGFEPCSTRYVRTGGGWATDLQGAPPRTDSAPVPHDGSRGRRTPGVVLDPPFRRDTSPGLISEPLRATWASYFPGIPVRDREGFAYPRPNSLEFFKLYAEPVSEFLRVGSLLLDSSDGLSAQEPLDETGALRDDAKFIKLGRNRSSLRFLNGLSESAAPIGIPDGGGGLRQAWWTPSLLGAIALMTLNAATGGMSPRICAAEGCGEIFTPARKSRVYHSMPCKERQKKRNQRARAGQRAGDEE